MDESIEWIKKTIHLSFRNSSILLANGGIGLSSLLKSSFWYCSATVVTLNHMTLNGNYLSMKDFDVYFSLISFQFHLSSEFYVGLWYNLKYAQSASYLLHKNNSSSKTMERIYRQLTMQQHSKTWTILSWSFQWRRNSISVHLVKGGR